MHAGSLEALRVTRPEAVASGHSERDHPIAGPTTPSPSRTASKARSRIPRRASLANLTPSGTPGRSTLAVGGKPDRVAHTMKIGTSSTETDLASPGESD